MLLRFLGRLFLYFYVIPFLSDVVKNVVTTTIKTNARKQSDPTWNVEKQARQDLNRAMRPRPRPTN